MARPVLPTDFKDDILAESMSGKRRYRIIQNTDGTVSLDDVTDYEQVGSTFGAKQVNDMSSAVNSIEDVKAANNCTTTEPGFVLDARQGKTLMDKSNELSRDLNAINDNGAIKGMEAREDGVYITYSPTGGADTVTKKLGSTIVLLGTVTTEQVFDLSMYPGFKNFALDTNIIGYVSGNYDADTGTLTIYTSSVSDTVTVSGYGYVMDGDIKRTGNGRMTGKATVNYPKQVYLLY